MTDSSPLINAMTVDVEDYFQVAALASRVRRSQWHEFSPRVVDNTLRLLELFERQRISATFFTLGWIAERHPALIKRIVEAGHELASHGYQHMRADEQSPEQFRRDIRQTKTLLEEVGGVPVLGYRAACFSIGAQNWWALQVLQEEGYRYSSSIYPVRHDLYGMPQAPRFRFEPPGVPGFSEIPISTLPLLGANRPCGGGGFFRLYPYLGSRWALRRLNQVERQPAVFYLHPWEIDAEQPRIAGLPMKSRLRHYLRLGSMHRRLERLCGDFAWGSMRQVFFADDLD